MYAVWVPQLGAQRANVAQGMEIVPDPRVRDYWDPQQVLGRAYEQTLPTPGPAWDVYLVFRRGVRWTAPLPPRPNFWMHQLGGVTSAPHLEPVTLRNHVKQMLGS